MSDVEGPRVFDMPHARVTLTPVGANVEIEVWPKTGQSAYAVVDPTVALLIAQELVELVAPQLADDEAAVTPSTRTRKATRSARKSADGPPLEPVPDNVVDLASRRPTRGRAG